MSVEYAIKNLNMNGITKRHMEQVLVNFMLLIVNLIDAENYFCNDIRDNWK